MSVLQAHAMIVETPIASSCPVRELETLVEPKSEELGSAGKGLLLRPRVQAQLRVKSKVLIAHLQGLVGDGKQFSLDNQSLLL